MPDSGIHNLGTIIKRLEAAASRLEDVALAAQFSSPFTATGSAQAAQQALVAHLPSSSGPADVPDSAVASDASPDGTSAANSPEYAAVKAYREQILEQAMTEYEAKSKEIGPIVEQHAALVKAVASAQLDFLKLASQCAKPSSQQAFLPLLSSTQEALQAVVEYKDSQYRSKEGRTWGNHLTAVGEGVGAWGWVTVEPAPAPFVGDMKDSAQFYTNRVLKEFKDTDPKQVAWSKSFIALLQALQTYVKQYYPTGVTWNPNGTDVSAYVKPGASGSSAPSTSSAQSPAPGAGGFLAELNRGEGVTSGLKKVDVSQMTHKNPNLRTTSVVSEKTAPERPVKPAKLANSTHAPTPASKKPAKTELDGTKWIVEYHEGNSAIVIDDTEINQTVQIFGCKNSVIQIKGKVNAINIVSCHKTSILFESVVSQLSVTSSPSFTVQILGMAPTILVDTTDSGQIYLSKQCLDTVEVITSKTSALNISIPGEEEGHFTERPIPEQMKTVIKEGKLLTTIVEHAG